MWFVVLTIPFLGSVLMLYFAVLRSEVSKVRLGEFLGTALLVCGEPC